MQISNIKFVNLNGSHQGAQRQILFSWESALNFEGSVPYIQYAGVRAKSILRKATESGYEIRLTDRSTFNIPAERELVKILSSYSIVIKNACLSHNPSHVAHFVFEVAKAFNNFYKEVPVLTADTQDKITSRLRLTAASLQTMENALKILGIEVPDVM